MDALGINLGYLIIQVFSFLILVLLLRGWLYAPISKVLEERKARIAKGLEDARQAAIARDNTAMLVFGLVLAIALMGFCATIIVKLLSRFPWISCGESVYGFENSEVQW